MADGNDRKLGSRPRLLLPDGFPLGERWNEAPVVLARSVELHSDFWLVYSILVSGSCASFSFSCCLDDEIGLILTTGA